MTDLPDEIDRINALTTNARNTWLVLLGVLVFVGITLMGVEHIDFYGVDRATKLPLVNVEVPTRYFFIAAPVLTAAIYGYFHLYLIRLWDVLGAAEARHNGHPLGDVIAPWLVSDAALHYRARKRRDFCVTARAMETPAMMLNIVLAWLFGLIILLFMWWQSMPARNLLTTGVAALSLLVALGVGTASYIMLIRRMQQRPDGPPDLRRSIAYLTAMLTAMLFILPLTCLRVTGIYAKNPNALAAIASVSMIEEEIIERPNGWLPYHTAREEFWAKWCKRNGGKTCESVNINDEEFAKEWQVRRNTTLSNVRRADWNKVGREKPNFQKAVLKASFLVRANLKGVNLVGADFTSAQMEGASLEGAQLVAAKLRGAQMIGADLRDAQMAGADLRRSQLEMAKLNDAKMIGADLRGVRLKKADLRDADMTETDLRGAQMDDADLRGAQMEQTKLRRARMQGAKLSNAEMTGADFSFSKLAGQSQDYVVLENTNIASATNKGGALRFADLSNVVFDEKTDFRNTFLDSSVKRPEGFDRQMGHPLNKPCQWVNARLGDSAFYSYWRWWVELSPIGTPWDLIAPPEWRDVPLPTEEELAKYDLINCHWKKGRLTRAPD